MRIQAIFLTLLLMLPGCFAEDEDEDIKFNGRDLEGSATYRFTLEDAEGRLCRRCRSRRVLLGSKS